MKHKQVVVKYVIEERGWPWSKWRKIKSWTEEVNHQEACNHSFAYSLSGQKRKCKKCGIKEISRKVLYLGEPLECWEELDETL